MPLRFSTNQQREKGKFIRTPPPLTRNIYYYGIMGSGKTCAMMSLSLKYMEKRGYKILDIFGGDRNENLYWAIPSTKKSYFLKLFNKVGEFDEEGPKQLQVNFLYPFFSSKIRNELPKKEGFVKSKLFTIPYKNIEDEQLGLVIRSVSDKSKYVWRTLIKKTRKRDCGEKLKNLTKKLKLDNNTLYRNFIEPLVEENFLQSLNYDLNLNLKKELKDKNTISILCLDMVPKDYHLFIMDYIMQETIRLIDRGELGKEPKVILLFREASRFLRATDRSSQDERYKLFRKRLSDSVRYGRRGMHHFFDTQSPKECRGMIEGAFDFIIVGRLASGSGDKSLVLDSLPHKYKFGEKKEDFISDFEPGEMFFIHNELRKPQFVKMMLPRTMYYEKGLGDFYKHVWESMVGEWKNITDIKEKVIEESKKVREKLKREKLFIKEMKKQDAETEINSGENGDGWLE